MRKIVKIILALVLAAGMAGESASAQNNQTKVSPQSDSLDDFITKRINVSEDKTIFTLFAMLNAAGYDDENNKQGMHPVRLRIRERVAGVISEQLKERLQNFYQGNRVEPLNHTYAVVATLTSGAPDFNFTGEWKDIENTAPYSRLKDLPLLLREFYRAVPVERMYEEVRPEYLNYIDNYRQVISKEVSKVMTYCRVKNVKELAGGGETKHAFIVPNLLESYESATSFSLNAGFYSIDGPYRRIGYNPHEFVHSITNPLSYNPKYRKLQQRAQPLLEAARELPFIQKNFKAIDGFFDECLVRAVSLKYLDMRDEKRAAILRSAMLDEYKSGYILERFFYEQLGEYERSKKSLREYYPQMLKRLDLEKEIKQWKETVKQKG